MRVVTVVGTRPEIIKLSRVMPALDQSAQHTLIHTGQNYDPSLNEVFFKELNLRRPDRIFDTANQSTSTIESLGAMMERLDVAFTQHNPDALLILGDTNSCVAAAYVAKRKKIPIFHMEAGNRCFDERVPEEVNRRIVDHISDINLPYSAIARENLLREGIPSDRIIKTGSPMTEVLGYYAPRIDKSQVLSQLKLTPGEYFVVSCHREENVDSPERLKQFLELLNMLAELGQRIIVSTHPRTQKKLARESATDLYDVAGFVSRLRPEIEFHKPFGLFDYVQLQRNARCTLSDSGTITEESSILGFPALNLRESHERPEGMEEANVMMTGFNISRVMESLPLTRKPMCTPTDYCSSQVSDKIVRIILSYVDVINRTVWRKNV